MKLFEFIYRLFLEFARVFQILYSDMLPSFNFVELLIDSTEDSSNTLEQVTLEILCWSSFMFLDSTVVSEEIKIIFFSLQLIYII